MFHSARLKLTAWYLLIIMFISLSFSAVIYKVLTFELDRFAKLQKHRIERYLRQGEFFPIEPRYRDMQFRTPIVDPELIAETKRRLIYMLAIVNGVILVLSGGLGYFLAGKTLRPIKEMMDEQGRFIQDASHELRTPLTSLKSSMEVNLRDRNLKLSQAKKLIRESIEEVDKLQSLSDRLLQLAQYENQNHYSVFSDVDIDQIIKQAVQKISRLSHKKNIKIKVNAKNGKIKGNKESLVDLLVILLDNATKYSKDGDVITIKTIKEDGFVKILVEDQGVGISQKDLPYIFDRFYRADTTRTKQDSEGFGLGLSIAKKIVESHQGTIEIKSKIGIGTAVHVKLPVDRS